MSIQNIVQQALEDGCLTANMEAEIGRICESAAELSPEEYVALDRLMGALLTGEITAVPQKQFINVMEELVISEAITWLQQLDNKNHPMPDLGDVAAYALNRLPPLYATSEEGANFQRQRAKDELQDIIRQQVKEGIKRYLERPNLVRQPLENTPKIAYEDLLAQMNRLLESFARDD